MCIRDSGKAIVAYRDPTAWPDLDYHRFTDRTIGSRHELEQEAQRIRSRGYARDEREHEDSIRCIAAPVFDSTNDPAAAISVSCPASRMSEKALLSHVDDLRGAAAAITRELGGDPERLGR